MLYTRKLIVAKTKTLTFVLVHTFNAIFLQATHNL